MLSKKDHQLDVNNYLRPKKKVNLKSAAPDIVVEGEDSDDNQINVLVEAFEDDGLVKDFRKEKKKDIQSEKPSDIDRNLPGWGSWGGAGIKAKSKQQRKKFMIEFPKKLPRKDDSKGNVIINEKIPTKIKSHMVSEVPFPFKTVKDYEASIRAPIGNTFVPETAFRQHIKPAVKTKMGSIITPATITNLMGKPKKKKK